MIYILYSADDQVMKAKDYEDIEFMIRKLIKMYEKSGLTVNRVKTKYTIIEGYTKINLNG